MEEDKTDDCESNRKAPNLRRIQSCNTCIHGGGYPEATFCQLYEYPAGCHGCICDDYE